MPEITINHPVAVKLKTKKGKDYFLIKEDGEDQGYFAWETEQGELAKRAEENGQSIIIVHDGDARFPTVEEVRGPIANGEAPAPRTTVHKSDGGDVLARAVNTALMQAVETVSHNVSKDMTPKDIAARVLPLAGSYLLWLKEKNGIETTVEDIPF